jgi:hypothetical protein
MINDPHSAHDRCELVGVWLRTELPLRDGSNGATNTEQADLDELGRHLLVELGGHLLVDGGAVQRFARRPLGTLLAALTGEPRTGWPSLMTT